MASRRSEYHAKVIFLKLGGSAITDKTREATPREAVIKRLAREVKAAWQRGSPASPLLLGHGSGSFGHFAAAKFGYATNQSGSSYVAIGAAAARLNRIVTDIFLDENLPVVSFQPSASARCRNGQLLGLALEPIQTALQHGLIPLVYGDVAFDETRGMSILCTEQIFSYLATALAPERILLSGVAAGVFTADPLNDATAELIPEITPRTFASIKARLQGSHGADVTGGMFGKVSSMLSLAQSHPWLTIRIVSAMDEGLLCRLLGDPNSQAGTAIRTD